MNTGRFTIRLKMMFFLSIIIMTSPIAIAFDSDGDGVDDTLDNCIEIANADQRDSNGDGFGSVCDADLDDNGFVNFADLSLFKSAFGSNNADADFDGNGFVNFADLSAFKLMFGKPPGPAGGDSNLSQQQAARFLTQATFGSTQTDIDHLVALGNYETWLNEQFAMSISLQLPYVKAKGNTSNPTHRHEIWWTNVIQGKDQLRQRVAFALSEIFVISDLDYSLANSQYGVSHYYDLLANNAFGNYRDLLEKVTLHPTMGIYLGILRNEKADPDRNVRPDENYAREILQLFSVGLYEMNIDGSHKKDTYGNPIPTYTQSTVEQFAKVFTGWNFADSNEWVSNDLTPYDKESPLIAWEQFHDTSEKTLLNRVLPAGQTAIQDLQQALDDIFLHSNVGPFISKLLIQRLVTSNPTPAYVARVAQVFNNNGANVRGDLGAVVTTILLDDEARNGHILLPKQFGKIKEPLLRLTQFWRALNASPGPTSDNIFRTGAMPPLHINLILGQAVLKSPSVFNFFLPDFLLFPNNNQESKLLVAPELQIMTEGNVAATNNDFHQSVYSYNNRLNGDHAITQINIDRELTIAPDTDNLIRHLDVLLLSGSMSPTMKQQIKTHLDSLPQGDDGLYYKVLDAIYMIVASPAYMIQQ